MYHPWCNSCPPHWLPGIQGAAKHCKCSYCIIHGASGYLYLGSLTLSFHSMHHILLSIHPHIVEGSVSHGHDCDMIFDLQLGYGQFHGRLSLPTPLPPPRPKNRLGRSTRLFLLFLARPCPTYRSSLVFLGVVGLAMAIYMAGCCCGSRCPLRRPKTA